MIGLARFGQFTFDETLGCVHILAGRQLKDSDGDKKEECLKEVHVGKGVMHVYNDNCAALKRMHIGVMASRKFSERIRVGCGLAEAGSLQIVQRGRIWPLPSACLAPTEAVLHTLLA